MKRKLLFRIGRVLQWIGNKAMRPGFKLSSFGLSLWDRNCDCVKCLERRDRL